MRRTKTFILVFLGLLAGAGLCAAASAGNGEATSAMISSARVPFVANEGQLANPDVKYYARTFGGTVYALSGGKIVYSLPKFESGKKAGSVVLTETLQGAFQSEPAGAGKSRVSVSSFIGNRPEKWKSNLPAFDKLDFGEVYEGVSLLLSARGNNVEKIFVVSPGADPREIAFGFEGASDIAVTDEGELELRTALGTVCFTRPVAWQIDDTGPERSIYGNFDDAISERFVIPAKAGIQERELLDSRLHGNDRRWRALHADKNNLSSPLRQGQVIPVEVSYALDEDGTVRFELASYDPAKVLVIDPLLASTFVGGGGADAVQAMAVDSQTNVYVAGYTDSSDFPTTNTPSSALSGGQDAFVSKFDANLGSLLASTYLGGSSNDQATAIGIAADSRVWLAGYTESTDFPHPSSPMCPTNNGGRDAFVAILSSSLTLDQATYLGGSNADHAAAIAMNNLSGRQYIVGYTESGNFPVSTAGYKTNYNGARDAFAVVFNNNVSSLNGGTFLGGTNADEAAGVVVMPGTAPTNFVYVVGATSSTNFPVTNAYQWGYGGGSNDAFVSRLSALLTNLPSSTFLGGTGSDVAYAVGLDMSNRVYVAGSTSSTNFPRNPGTGNEYLSGYTNAYRGGQDIFVSCLTNSVSNLYASTYAGGTGDEAVKSLVVASSSATNIEYIYLAGYTTSSNFPTTPNAYDRSYNGGQDAFTLRFDARLTNMYASTYLGGDGDDQALALALAPDSNTLFTAGITASDNFPSSDAAYETAFRGGASDGFVTKFPASLAYGTVKWRKSLEGSRCSSPALTWDGTVVLGNSTSLYAYTRSGDVRWWKTTTSSVAMQIQILAGLGSPAVGTNDVVYINTSNGTVYAITSAGILTTLFETTPQLRWSSIALDNENQLIFSQGSTLYSVGVNGAIPWTKPLIGNNYSSPAISSNRTIYAVDSDAPAKLYAVRSDGSTSNTWTTVGPMYSSPALDTNGTIYSASGNKLYAFNPNGTTAQTWSAAGDILSSPAIGTNGVIYVGGGSNLYAFVNSTTAKVWNTGNPIKSSPAIAADGSIIVGAAKPDATGIIYSFNPDGTTNWVYETDYEIHFPSPLIDSEGTIYISDLFYIYAIYGSAPPAASAWPMFRHDALRTGNQGMNAASFLRPTGVSASKYGIYTDYVRVSWDASPNALSYELWRNTSNSTAGAAIIRKQVQNSYNDTTMEPGRLYYYWVKVKTPIALSDFSASDYGGIPPLPPAGVTASDGVPTDHVQVTWPASTNATAYYVYRSLADLTNTAVQIVATSSTNYSDYIVQPGLRYYYWVKAGNADAGISRFSVSDYGGIPCWPPSGFSASQGAYIRSVVLSWNASTNASSYIVHRNTEDNSGTAVIITNTSGSPMSDYTGTPLRRYYYWVKATNEFGSSGFSSSTPGWSLLAPPVSVSASSGAYPNMIRVSWIAGSTDATVHVIFRSESSDSSTATRQSEVVFNDPTATNYDDTAISRGVSYYYWVAAMNNYGTSAWTAASAPGGTIPATPSDLNATDGTLSNEVLVTWSSSPGSSSYAVYRHETYDSSFAVQIGSASTNYYDDSSALHGEVYYYWVKAGNAFGFSALSTFNSGWRGMVPPDSISAVKGYSTSEVSVTWSAAPDATAYELWRGSSSDSGSASRLVNNVSGVYYGDQTANPGSFYYYWVKAKRGNYVSVFSGYDYGYRAIGLLDIAVSDFVFVPAAFGPLAHPSAASFKVSNLSALNMVEPNNTVQYDFYLSENAVFDVNDRWIGGSDTSLTLNAGASTRIVCPAGVRSAITIPSGLAGNYYVFVYIDHCLPATWLDPNLANNAARRLGDTISIGSTTALQPIWNDYDGDGKSDLAVYNGSTGSWKIWLSASDYAQVGLAGFGGAGCRAVPRDYDGDGILDRAIYQATPSAGSTGSPQPGVWIVCLSASGYQTVSVFGWGGAGQVAIPADYDGDGKADPAVYEETTGTWRGWMSGSGYAEVNASGMGGSGWRPAPADYDGDAKTDPAIYQESTGTWRVWLSGSGYQEVYVINWGGPGQLPVPADYDADGRVDPAVYQPADGWWRVWLSGSGYRENGVSGWGGSGQTAIPGDYDGDGKVDPAVYWESMGIWRIWLSRYGYTKIEILAPGGIDFKAITAEEM